MSTLGQTVVAALRRIAHAYVAGDQAPPCAVLWTDPDRQWAAAVESLMPNMSELYVLGTHTPGQRTGPALWLRCVEARVIEDAPPAGTTPIFYLPGVSREQLRAVEECPLDLAPLVELQFRGVMWLHVNGKDWTPNAFLVSSHGGLELEVAKDQATLDALLRALPSLLNEPLAQLKTRRLDAEYLNGLVAPDATGLLLQWLSDSEAFKERQTDTQWRAFCEQCKADFSFDPVKDGPLKAAQLLAQRATPWNNAWRRYAESPTNYPGVISWLRRAEPKTPDIFDSAEVWPAINDEEESKLREEFEKLCDRPQGEVINRLIELEAQEAIRRTYPWQKLGLNPMATALEPLAQLARMCASTPGAPTPDEYAALYAGEGWRVDAATMATLAACGATDQHGAVLGVVRAVYLPWLDVTARHLQQLIASAGQEAPKREKTIELAPGRVVLFADGLRMDVSRRLVEKLEAAGLKCTQDWEWSTIPSVTATAKPAVSPIGDTFQGGEAGDEFATRLSGSGQPLTQDRFLAALRDRGWQCLGAEEVGDPSGSAWAECGALDKRGHSEGWKLARSADAEVRDLSNRIGSLLRGGWREVIVVTDHGWLLMPGGLPKIELKSFLAEHRWGRCAMLKPGAQADTPVYKWHWNSEVAIASPPGAGCFRSGMEYSHGGVSLQEMVVPVLHVVAAHYANGAARLAEAKWTGAVCRLRVTGSLVGLTVDIRTSMADAETSLLPKGSNREVAPDGKATVFLDDDANIGKPAEIVLLDASKQVIDSLSTTLGA